MKRVVITGAGIVSSLGNSLDEVSTSLRLGKSGIANNETFKDVGMRSHISGHIEFDTTALVPKRVARFMGRGGAYGYHAMEQAIESSGLSREDVSNERVGLIIGSGGGATDEILDSVEVMRAKGIRKVGPYRVTRGMHSSTVACLATAFEIRGVSYAVTSACATSAHAIGAAYEQILLGKQDVMFAGGSDDIHWTMALQFDAMGALSTGYNDRPDQASRPYDATRDGFVISGGAGVLVLEELNHALARGAHILAEITGFGATSDGDDMVQPSGEGAIRCMKQAMGGRMAVDYINAHGTSTRIGDVKELNAIRSVFSDQAPPVSSTKALGGHAIGAAGVHEAIHCLLMMRDGFMVGSHNLDTPDEAIAEYPLCRNTHDVQLNRVLSNSFGFGGTNASLVFERFDPESAHKRAVA
jgi:3-oxoacyl-[acyl-carrier-protein] synthase-1